MNESKFLNLWLYGIFVFVPIVFLLSRTKLAKSFQLLVSNSFVLRKVWYVLIRILFTVLLLQLALAVPHILRGLYAFFFPFFHPEMFAKFEDGGILWIFSGLPFFHFARGSMENYKLLVLFPYTTVICMLIYIGWVVCGEYLLRNRRRSIKYLIISIPFVALAVGNFIYWPSVDDLWYEHYRVIQSYEIGIPSNDNISILLEVTHINHTPQSDTFEGNLLVTEGGERISYSNMSSEGRSFSYGGTNFWWDSVDKKHKCIEQMGADWCNLAHIDNTEFQFYYIQGIGLIMASWNKDLPIANNDRQSYYLTLISWYEPWQWNPRNGKYECQSFISESLPSRNSISTCLKNYIDADLTNTKLKKVFSFVGDGNRLPIINNDQAEINKFWQKIKDKEWIQLSILHSSGNDTF